MRVIACGSPYGRGGIGQHFAQLVESTRDEGRLYHYFAPALRPGDEAIATPIDLTLFHLVRRFTPVRWSKKWTSHLKGEIFDAAVARQLRPGGTHFMGFVGKTLRSFRRARALGYETLELVAVNSHVDHVLHMHRRAEKETGIRDAWMGEPQRRKTLAEYELADVIYVHSEFTRQTFVDAGVPPDKLVRMRLAVDDRFEPPAERIPGDRFRVAYVGRLDSTKGVPNLVEAFRELDMADAELVLVGSWSSPPMRRYMERAMERDARIRLAPGDPLPVLHAADLLVHPAYEDGFGYAPAEALAAGVPVVVTEDTGMRERIRDGENGYVVPTGDVDALKRHILRAARRFAHASGDGSPDDLNSTSSRVTPSVQE